MTNPVLFASDPTDDPLAIAPNDSTDLSGSAADPQQELDGSSSIPLSFAEKLAQHSPEIRIFFSTFFTIFLAELGDKTQLTTLLMVAGTRSPWVVFLGAGAALVLTTLLGVLLGRWIATKVSPQTLETAAGTMLLIISALLLWDVVNL